MNQGTYINNEHCRDVVIKNFQRDIIVIPLQLKNQCLTRFGDERKRSSIHNTVTV